VAKGLLRDWQTPVQEHDYCLLYFRRTTLEFRNGIL
jgi:hypothetical protein